MRRGSEYLRYRWGREMMRRNSLRDFALLSRVSLEFRLSFTEYDNPAPYVRPLLPPLILFFRKPKDPTNSCPLSTSLPVSTSVTNSVSDVINVRCLMIVILNVRRTKKFYRVRYWRAVLFFSRRRFVCIMPRISRLSSARSVYSIDENQFV